MGKIAFVFAGQGAQYSGMGKTLYENSPACKALYDAAEAYRPGTMAQSFAGTAEELKLTENTQPCLYLCDLAAALALTEKGVKPDAVAGFSLGEIAALAYAGAYTGEEGFKIVTSRGKAMGEAAGKYDTAMAAILKLDAATIEQLCAEVGDVYPVNYNSAAQTVVSGTKTAIAALKEKLTSYPCRVMDLAVSGAFHSPFMAEAAEAFGAGLADFDIKTPSLPVYANKTAQPYGDDVKETMTAQIKSPVLWEKTVLNLIGEGFDTFIEVGAGKTLTGLIKKIDKNVKVYNVDDYASVAETAAAVSAANEVLA